jgi:rhomboid protease GluP
MTQEFPPPPNFEKPAAVAPPASQPQARVQFPRRKPYVTYAILALTILVFLAQQVSDIPFIYGLKINEAISAGQYWRLFTPMLLHGGLVHIGFNMYALYAIGRSLERDFGHVRFLLLYMVSGFAGTVVSFALTDAPSLGASTAVFGIFASQAIFAWQNKKIFGPRANMIIRQVANLALINFLIGLSPGIDNWGHLGGFVGGILYMVLAGPIWELRGSFPTFTVEDTRPEGHVFGAALLVGLIFAGITLGLIIVGIR